MPPPGDHTLVYRGSQLQLNVAQWFRKLDNEFGVGIGNCIASNFQKKMQKHELATSLEECVQYMKDQCSHLKSYDIEVDSTAARLQEAQRDLIDAQKRIVNLQQELLDSKSAEVNQLKSTVTETVEKSLKIEFQSYSDKLASNLPKTTAMAPRTIKSVVKSVVEEEDRSRSLMIFGLAEEEDELLSQKVDTVFEEMGIKPRQEACRLGKTLQPRKTRPVRVTVSSATVANSILLRARELKDSKLFSSVFVRRDRSPEDRAKHKELVLELRGKREADPMHKHFIRAGKVITAPI